MLAVRLHPNLDLYADCIVSKRWTRDYLKQSSNVFVDSNSKEASTSFTVANSDFSATTNDQSCVQHSHVNAAPALSVHQKFAKARVACLSLASALSNMPTSTFEDNLKEINKMELIARNQNNFYCSDTPVEGKGETRSSDQHVLLEFGPEYAHGEFFF